MKVIRVMDSSGDREVKFGETDLKATEEAKALFETMISSGATAFATHRENGEPDKIVKHFAQLENETLIVPKIVGG